MFARGNNKGWIFLDDADRQRFRSVLARGVRVAARDLPANPSHPIESWLGDSESRDAGR